MYTTFHTSKYQIHQPAFKNLLKYSLKRMRSDTFKFAWFCFWQKISIAIEVFKLYTEGAPMVAVSIGFPKVKPSLKSMELGLVFFWYQQKMQLEDNWDQQRQFLGVCLPPDIGSVLVKTLHEVANMTCAWIMKKTGYPWRQQLPTGKETSFDGKI